MSGGIYKDEQTQSKYSRKKNSVLQRFLAMPKNQWVVGVQDIKDDLFEGRYDQNIVYVFRTLMTDNDYAGSICVSIIDYNLRNPYEVWNPTNFPDEKLLIDMSVADLLKSRMTYQALNSLAASSGGAQINPNELWRNIVTLLQILNADIEPRIRQRKLILNDRNAYGGYVPDNLFRFYGCN